MQEFDLAWNTGLLVHAAALLQVFGFLNRNHLVLRCFILCGSLVYVAYYYLYPDSPLWGAIFWSTALALANLAGIARVLLDRRRSRLGEHEDSFFNILKVLTPGEFRRLMQIAEWRVAEKPTQLTREGEAVPSLYFVISGDVDVEKSGRTLTHGPGVFIGEVSMVLGGTATASVTLAPGSRYIEWQRQKLRKTIERSPSLGESINRLFNQEMARKLAVSWSR